MLIPSAVRNGFKEIGDTFMHWWRFSCVLSEAEFNAFRDTQGLWETKPLHFIANSSYHNPPVVKRGKYGTTIMYRGGFVE